ncbi:MAG: polyisoprenyl-teichoic acid--peptidoglycan teichoic acid transferase [Thermosediminibacterales bacterium]|nr:polyisoprenyl-teichoic acid--peptidoglycan teichoic acid transferase [Thermosediminibacterales bacterium]MDK2835498.1 polyisoprenyl-teichoic acid--peptidoglycan teichoic acid transferase [Thermosediminibacterales bacterium]
MKKPVYIILFVLFCFLLAIGTGFYVYLKSFGPNDINVSKGVDRETDMPNNSSDKKINILVLGVDAGIIGVPNSHKRSDTIFVVSFDQDTKDVKLLSIPRDTRVIIPGHGFDKINAANAYGGPELAIKTVKNFLDIPIHHYIKIDYQGFKQIVDDLDGVEIYVERPMHYDDDAGNLHIHLDEGLQLLDGDKAEQFVRYRRYPNGDIGRIQAQQKFLEAFARKLLQPGSVLKLPKIAKTLTSYIETDMEPGEIIKYANMARTVNIDKIQMAVVPGIDDYINGISYFFADEDKTQEIVDEFFRDIDPENMNITVQVLNGNGVSGAASNIALSLKQKGFQVVKVGNADNFDYERTKVIYKSGEIDAAKKVAKIVKSVDFIAEDSNKLSSDVVVIVGKDRI